MYKRAGEDCSVKQRRKLPDIKYNSAMSCPSPLCDTEGSRHCEFGDNSKGGIPKFVNT
jgi:hypothetical protein